jgi:D-serine deaminase-like pyridoxal phosphate-dependent protein
MANIGVCTPRDIALSALATVIGHQAEKGWAIVDAGWMAMSRDRGTQAQKTDYGYGAVCDMDDRLLDGWAVTAAHQEHGIVSRRDGASGPDVVARFPVGSRLRILPNHACATATQFPEYHVVAAGGATSTWRRFDGW